jgi:hypothetical protein
VRNATTDQENASRIADFLASRPGLLFTAVVLFEDLHRAFEAIEKAGGGWLLLNHASAEAVTLAADRAFEGRGIDMIPGGEAAYVFAQLLARRPRARCETGGAWAPTGN